MGVEIPRSARPVVGMAVAGKVGVAILRGERLLRMAPCPLEVVGGADDGEVIFPNFSLHIAHLIEVFDGVPEILWSTMNGEISLDGKIDGEEAWIMLYDRPFDDEEPGDVLDPEGGIRPKRPLND